MQTRTAAAPVKVDYRTLPAACKNFPPLTAATKCLKSDARSGLTRRNAASATSTSGIESGAANKKAPESGAFP
jgi:hypothetical protein